MMTLYVPYIHRLLYIIYSQNVKYLATEPSEGFLETFKKLSPHIEAKQCDATSIPLAAESVKVRISLWYICKTATLKTTTQMVFKTNYCLMQVKSIAECSNGSILQYVQPSLSYHLSLRSLFCLFLVAVVHMFYCIHV